MARINLLGGTYQARSLIADAQRCLNLYPAKNPEDASAPYTNLLTPGTLLKATRNVAGVARCLYTATNGSLYYVCGQQVYFIDSTWTLHLLGALAANLTTPVAMQDNGLVIILVDGTTAGYAINLQSGIVGQPLAGQVTNAGSAGGQPNALAITAPGSGATNGVYPNCPLTGGSGSNGAAAITVTNPFTVAVSYSGLTLTMTTTVAHGLTAGSVFTVSGSGAVTISGVDIPNLNGTWTALSGTAGTTLKWTLPAGPQGTGPNLGAVSAGGTGEITIAIPLPVGTGYAVNDTVGVTGVTGLSGETLTVTSVGAISGTYSGIALTGGTGAGAT